MPEPKHMPCSLLGHCQILRVFAGSSTSPGSDASGSGGGGGANNAAEVLLVSLKSGGVGMNLTAANHVHLLDPWWNPAVEDQVTVI